VNIDIAPATDKDSGILANILTEATKYKVEHGDYTWGNDPYTVDEVKHYMKNGNVFIVILDNEPVGSFSLQWEDRRIWGEQPSNAAYLHQLAIKSSLHGRGLGEQIIKRAEEESLKNEKKIFRLDCEENNLGLCKYYEKQGFKKVGSKKVTSEIGTYKAALYEKLLVVE